MTFLLLLIIALLFLIPSGSSDFNVRIKRIINGIPFKGRPAAVSVIKYYGAIGSVHGVPWRAYGFLDALEVAYGNLDCAGSLIAPSIFHTACHCLTIFDRIPEDDYFLTPFIKSHWEARSNLYIGTSHMFGPESMVRYNPIMSEAFFIHSQCGKLGKNGVATYDYGMIRLNVDWFSSRGFSAYPWAEINWAPQYTDREILKNLRHAMKKELVCMILGFGDFKNHTSQSRVLRHGWVVLFSHIYCVMKSARIQGRAMSKVERAAYMSWMCTQGFKPFNHNTAPGDSGSPLTCESKYIGTLSGRTLSKVDGTEQLLSLYHTLAHNMYATAINYRSALIRLIRQNPPKFLP